MKKITSRAWRARYYPVNASRVSKKNALEHSIHKWIGLLLYGNVADIKINYTTCALCQHYRKNKPKEDECKDCPLYKSRNQIACDRTKQNESCSPYSEWSYNSNALPMVQALVKARDYLGN